MAELIVTGGRRLEGSVRIPRSKNSVLPILAAALLCEGESRICDVPCLSDVDTSLALLNAVGACACREGTDVLVCASNRMKPSVPDSLSGAMRSSVYYIVPLLYRCGEAHISFPGGCRIGARPINLHIEGLRAMGAEIETHPNTIICRAPKGLHGANFCLSFPSVGATETLMMAAAFAKGRTVLCGCAKEPEITDLARFLRRCGARIQGAGGTCMTIDGVERLKAVAHTPIPDRITAATVLFGVAACGGDVTLTGVRYSHLNAVLHTLSAMGAELCRPEPGVLRIRMEKRPDAAFVTTGVYPEFPTDAGPLFAAAALQATGESMIRETIFENRFACAAEFCRLGAEAHVQNSRLYINGVSGLKGGLLASQDLRGGAALVIAALAAQGKSRITGIEYIARGYEDIAQLFGRIGAELYWEN